MIYELLKARANDTPDNVALCAPGRSGLNYQALIRQIEIVINALIAKGVHADDPVAVVLPNGPEMAVAILGASATAIGAPLNPTYGPDEFDFYFTDIKPKALIIESGMNSPAIEIAKRRNIAVIELTPITAAAAGIFTIIDIEHSFAPDIQLPRQSDCALLLHTSGTTSRPKMVPLTHEKLLASSQNIASTLRLTKADRCLNVMPLFHIHGLVGALLSSVMAGGSIVCTGSFNIEQFFPWIETFRPTWYTAVPTIHHAVLSAAQSDRRALINHSLRFIRSSSSALPVRVMEGLEEMFKVPVIESYGMTEAAHQMASNPLPPRERKPGSVGVAAGPEIAIMDEAGNLLSNGETGEIVIRGANVMGGYANNSNANNAAFTQGWFKTGDQGNLDKDGYLFLTGRIKEIINRGGEKISPREVEDAILQHPAVEQAACFALPHKTLGEDIAAAVVLRKNAAMNAEELQRFVAPQLAEFKVPRHILFVNEIPKGATGKPQRVGLAETFRELLSEQRLHEFLAPQTPTQSTLATIWSEVLGVEQIGIHDNFFDLGGDSILAVQVISRVRKSMHTELSIASFFETPTVAGLIECIEKAPRIDRQRQALPMQRIARSEKLPLSFAQRRLWFLNQLEPANPVYNRPLALRLTGRLHVHSLERCLDEIIRRHEVLRTNFQDNDGDPVQTVMPSLTVNLPVIDLSPLRDDQRESEVHRLAIWESQQPFDLAQGALLRIRLYRLGEQDHLLLFVTHHIVFDGWSESVLVGELAAYYSAIINDKPIGLSDLPVQYADYATWQHQHDEERSLDTDLAYWKKRLGNFPSLLNLPTDRPRPAVQTHIGAKQAFALPELLSIRLKEFSRIENVTLFMTLLSAFKTLLYRYTGQDDILVGVPTAGRDRIETEPLLGVFINTLVLRTDLSGAPSFRQLLRRVREVALGAYSHQNLAFEKLIEVLQPARDLGRNPFFDVMFQLRNVPQPVIASAELGISFLDLDVGIAKFDLILEVSEEHEHLGCRFEYNTDLFDFSTIERMVGHFQTLLEAIVANPDQSIRDLPLLTEFEKRQLLVEWNDAKCDYPKDKCVPELFENQVEKTPDAIAVIFEDQQLTYRELNRRANQIAHHLQKLGVGPEVLVGICVERSMDAIVGMLGILKAGGAYVPMDPSYPRERLSFMLEDAQIPVLLTQQRVLDGLPDCAIRIVCVDDARERIDHESDLNPLMNELTSQNLAFVLYTSGSTGQPKGVMINHQSLVNYLYWFNKSLPAKSMQYLPVVSRLTVDAHLKQLFAPLLRAGQVWVLADDVATQPIALLEKLATRSQVGLNCIPSLWRAILDDLTLDRATALRNSLSVILLGGEQLDQSLVERTFAALPDIEIWNLYGPTETTANATTGIVTPHCPPTIGRPIANTQVYILDAHRQLLPIGIPGELHIGGDGLARGYLNRPELTREKFITNPFGSDFTSRLYKTGDLARYLPDGSIEFIGRIDDQVKIRGFRIELGEIEAVLVQHTAIQQAIVLAREDNPGDRRLVAYAVAGPDSSPSVNELHSFLRQKLPEHMVPSAYVLLESLPLTANGKLDRKALPAPDQTRPDLNDAFTAPQTTIQEILARIWSEVLKLDKVGIHDNFFALGGHSLLAIQIASRIRHALSIELPLRQLFQSPTVAGLAIIIAGIQTNRTSETDLADILREVETTTEEEAQKTLATSSRR